MLTGLCLGVPRHQHARSADSSVVILGHEMRPAAVPVVDGNTGPLSAAGRRLHGRRRSGSGTKIVTIGRRKVVVGGLQVRGDSNARVAMRIAAVTVQLVECPPGPRLERSPPGHRADSRRVRRSPPVELEACGEPDARYV